MQSVATCSVVHASYGCPRDIRECMFIWSKAISLNARTHRCAAKNARCVNVDVRTRRLSSTEHTERSIRLLAKVAQPGSIVAQPSTIMMHELTGIIPSES